MTRLDRLDGLSLWWRMAQDEDDYYSFMSSMSDDFIVVEAVAYGPDEMPSFVACRGKVVSADAVHA